MALNGISVLVTVRKRFPGSMETHPKVLYWHLAQQRHSYLANQVSMDAILSDQIGVPVATFNEHEWDAAASALAAFKGLVGTWSRDLHWLPAAEDERLVAPAA